MLKTKQSLNLIKTLRTFGKFVFLHIKFIHDHKKTCAAAKILGSLHFFIVFVGSPLNFDKEKWYYMYTDQFLRNDVFLIF